MISEKKARSRKSDLGSWFFKYADIVVTLGVTICAYFSSIRVAEASHCGVVAN